MSFITTKLFGLRQLLFAGNPLPERPALNFVSGATCVDNPVTNATDVTIDESTVFVSATNLATSNAICKRSISGSANFAGTCHFVDVQAAGGFTASTCGLTGVLTVGGSSSFAAAVACAAGLTVTGATSVGSLSATSMTCSGNSSTTGTLTAGATTVTSMTCTGSASVATNLAVSGNMSVVGAATVGSLTSGADVTCASGSHFKLGGTRTYTRTCGPMPVMDPSRWSFGTSTIITSTGTGNTLFVPIERLPDGATLTSVSVWVSSAATAHTLPLPTTKRQVSLVYITSSTGAETATWTTSDPGTTAAAYDGYHAIVATGAPVTFNRAIIAAYIQLIDESGANSIASDTKYYVADYTYTMDRVVDT